MVSETIEKGITLGYLMSSLSTPITEMKAFDLGIINEYGKSIDMHVVRLREKLRDHKGSPEVLLTVRGKGYMLATQVSPL